MTKRRWQQWPPCVTPAVSGQEQEMCLRLSLYFSICYDPDIMNVVRFPDANVRGMSRSRQGTRIDARGRALQDFFQAGNGAWRRRGHAPKATPALDLLPWKSPGPARPGGGGRKCPSPARAGRSWPHPPSSRGPRPSCSVRRRRSTGRYPVWRSASFQGAPAWVSGRAPWWAAQSAIALQVQAWCLS
jgi:hypothetical protein